MYEDWKHEDTARNWDADPTTYNPTRAEQLDIMLAILEDAHQPGKAILDVGLGSGIVEELIFKRIPGSYVVGIDSSEAMIALARRRLEPYKERYTVLVHDITETGSLELPDLEYQAAISVRTIHNVADEYKQPIVEFIHRSLEPGGLFLLIDRIVVDTPNLFDCYRSVWNRLDRLHNTHHREGGTFEEHIQRVRVRGDLPANLEQNLAWLREAGFEAACLHLHANRALIAA